MLKAMSLASLGETKAATQFDEAMATIIESFEKDGDVEGARTLDLKLSFGKTDSGHIVTTISASAKTPNRKVGTIAAIEDGVFKIDTKSGDIRQPGLPLGEAGNNVTPIIGG